jgi:hypothetical protein
MIKNIKSGIKTTIVGSILILTSLATLFLVEDMDKAIFFGTLVSGIALLFSPDAYIKGIKKLIGIFSKKATEIDIEDEINKKL